MALFAIIAPGYDTRLTTAIQNIFPGKHFEIAPGQFVAVAPSLTAAQIAEQIGPNEKVGQYVVFSVAGYWGYHRKDLWEWLTANPG